MFIQDRAISKVFFLIVLLVCKMSPGFCQANFLRNGDFENINNCKEFNAECGVEAWFYLYGKGKLPVELTGNKEDNLTRFEAPAAARVKPDTLKLSDVLFDFNKADLKANATKVLETFFRYNDDKSAIDSIYIEGHTDSVGSDNKNIVLSQQRCEAVMKWIISNNIAGLANIAVHPFGRVRPVASNKTAARRALNRRVEIIVFRKQNQ